MSCSFGQGNSEVFFSSKGICCSLVGVQQKSIKICFILCAFSTKGRARLRKGPQNGPFQFERYKMNILSILGLCFCICTISLTITKSSLFHPLRSYFFNRNNKRFFNFFYELFSCPYCFSHYVSFFFVLTYGVRFIISDLWFLDYIVSVFALTSASSLISYVLLKLMDEK